MQNVQNVHLNLSIVVNGDFNVSGHENHSRNVQLKVPSNPHKMWPWVGGLCNYNLSHEDI